VAAEIVFSGGERVEVPAANAEVLMQTLNSAREGRRQTPSGPLPSGWIDVETRQGVIYVNPGQVAYVRDKPERHGQTLSGLEGEVVGGSA
jgi:hypothetical protein